ncbi:MAG: PEP-CTERM sorting domain-containing protein [Planctomycetota bacterium]|jgi:hypothetical protein
MSKCKVVLVPVVVFSLFTCSVQASLVDIDAGVTTAWKPTGGVITADYGLGSDKIPKTDSEFSVSSTPTNDTSFTWTAYILELDPTELATFVPGSGSSSVFTNVSDIDAWTMRFDAPAAVLPGESVKFTMQISVSGPSPHTFSLTHTPIPEPATVALLGIGALALVVRRKTN